MAEIAAEHGIVMIQAQTMLPATPQRTALIRFREPTPMIAPVIVCVVLTGIPSAEAINKLVAAPDSAQKPSTGRIFATFCPMVFTMRQPPDIVPSAIALWHVITIQKGI